MKERYEAPSPRLAERRELGAKKLQGAEGQKPRARAGGGGSGPKKPMRDAGRGPGLRS